MQFFLDKCEFELRPAGSFNQGDELNIYIYISCISVAIPHIYLHIYQYKKFVKNSTDLLVS